MAATRRRATSPQQDTTPPSQPPPAVAQVIAMLASIDAATTRLEQKVSDLLAEVAALTPPAPRRPAARHAPAARLSCRGHRPRLARTRQCTGNRGRRQ